MKISNAWPNQDQLTLLKAALLAPDEAEPYWQQFIATRNIQNLDHGCNQVLPMVFINLKGRMKDDINKKVCRSSYRFVWANNHLLMHDAKAMLLLLKKHNLQVCLLKGAAFIGHYFPDYGMRVLGDIDLLVLPNNLSEVVNIFESNHYQIKSNQSDVNVRDLFRIFHARSFINQRGTEIDVHQYLSKFLINAEFSERIWKNKVSIDLFGSENLAYVLSPTYQLLHTVVHGLQYAPVSSIRWIVDAASLLKNPSADIEWNELIEVCSKHHLNLPMSLALIFLAEEMSLSIPDNVLSCFDSQKLTSKDKKYFSRSSRLGIHSTYERVKRSWEHYKIYSATSSEKYRLLGFYDFLMVYFDLKSRWMLVPYVVRKLSGVFWRCISMFFKQYYSKKRTT